MNLPQIEAVLFDKDGTLFDFAATWNDFALRLLDHLAEGEAQRRESLAQALGFDLDTGGFLPDSPVIAGTNRQVASLIAPLLKDWDVDALERLIIRQAADAPLTEAVPLVPFLAGLAARGLTLGVMTNDSEEVARAHLRTSGIEGMFDFVAGADSGYGSKPSPLPLLAFARATGHTPDSVVMVGDSLHDLAAGRAAGMWTAGVLTGLAAAETLAPMADVVLPDIGHLPQWLGRMGTMAAF
jgi:phosphoglycolate phosphatase